MDKTKTITKMMVALKSDLSRPRRVVYSSPDAPKPAPSEAPRCCKRIKRILSAAEIKVVVCKIEPNSIITFHYTLE